MRVRFSGDYYCSGCELKVDLAQPVVVLTRVNFPDQDTSNMEHSIFHGECFDRQTDQPTGLIESLGACNGIEKEPAQKKALPPPDAPPLASG